MSMFSRREFMKDSALFGAAAAALGNVPLRAADAPAVKKVGANDQIRVAQIGFNGQGNGHLKRWAGMKDTIVTHICDADSRLARRGVRTVTQGGQKHEPEYVQDMRKIFDNPNIDVVSIATPNHWHALASIWAMQSGKDVYCEKPISHNVWEGRRIVDFARKLGRICQCGTQSRSNKGMREAIDFIHSGKIGKVSVARGLCYKRRPSIGRVVEKDAPSTVDYNLWLGPAPQKPVSRIRFHYDWHWQWDYGNGDLGNQGIHEMDKARWGLGKGLPNAVFSLGGRFGYEDAGETANSQICYFDYGDAQLIFEVRGLNIARGPMDEKHKGKWVGNIWYGTEGYVVSESYSSAVAMTPDGEVIKKFGGGGSHFGNFIDAVRSRKHTDLNADCEEGHLSSALCHLGNISYRVGKEQPYDPKVAHGKTAKLDEVANLFWEHLARNKIEMSSLTPRVGRELTFDPSSERFTSDAEANAQLTRDYRAPFVVPEDQQA